MKLRCRLPYLGLAILAAALVHPKIPASESRVSKQAIDRIQRDCLHTYPEEVRGKMASGAKEIPADVEADPKAQMQFLDKELEVEKGLFYPSLLEEVLPPFERYVKPGVRFLDLGSGDGRVVFLANLLGAHSTGIEWDPMLLEVSLEAQRKLADLVDGKRIELVQGDFFEMSWAPYDVIFYFDTSSVEHERLRRKMKKELGPEARLIVGHEIFPFEGYDLEAKFKNMLVYRQRGED